MQRSPIANVRSSGLPSLLRFLAPRAYNPWQKLVDERSRALKEGGRTGEEHGRSGSGCGNNATASVIRDIRSTGISQTTKKKLLRPPYGHPRGIYVGDLNHPSLNTESRRSYAIFRYPFKRESTSDPKSTEALSQNPDPNQDSLNSIDQDSAAPQGNEDGWSSGDAPDSQVTTLKEKEPTDLFEDNSYQRLDENWEVKFTNWPRWSSKAWTQWQKDVRDALSVEQETSNQDPEVAEETKFILERMLRETPEFWVETMHAIGAKYKKGFTPTDEDIPGPPALDLRSKGWVKLLFSEGSSVEDIRTVWESISLVDRIEWWPHIMLWLLDNQPDNAMKTLLATLAQPAPSLYAIRDILWFLAEHHLRHLPRFKTFASIEFVEDVLELLASLNCQDIKLHVSSRTLWLLASRCNHSHRNRLLEYADGAKLCLSPDGNGLLAYLYGRESNYSQALRYLNDAILSGLDSDSEVVARVVNTILRQSVMASGGYANSKAIVGEVLQMGLKLNLIHYTSLIENAFASNDIQMALSLFDLLESDIAPNSVTYATMLRGLRAEPHSGAHSVIFNAANDYVMSFIKTEGSQPLRQFDDERAVVILANEILYTKYLQFERETVEEHRTFSNLLPIYLKFFQPDTLVELDILPPTSTAGYEYKLKPDVASVHIMLCVWLRSLKRRSAIEETTSLLHVYDRYRVLSQSKNELIAELAKGAYTASSFVMAFGRHRKSLPFCLKVMTDMGLPITREPKHIEAVKTHALPNVVTYSTLIHALMKHEQPAAAEKVFELMQKKGVRPNTYTWNSLIGGYATMQNSEEAVRILGNMQAEGIRPNVVTMTVLGKIQNRDKLRKVLSQQQQQSSDSQESPLVQEEELPPGIAEKHSDSAERIQKREASKRALKEFTRPRDETKWPDPEILEMPENEVISEADLQAITAEVDGVSTNGTSFKPSS